jgi:hypothetical protein
MIASIGISNICTAFEGKTIGSKVVNPLFIYRLLDAIKDFDWSECRVPGQAFIPVDAADCVVSGVGLNTSDPKDYVLRSYRGKVDAYLKREHALPTVGVNVVLYTEEAYALDPQVTPEEVERMQGHRWDFDPFGGRYVIVAVLADAGTPSTRSPYRFVDCLAGGNNEADTWTIEDVRAMSREIINNAKFGIVAD